MVSLWVYLRSEDWNSELAASAIKKHQLTNCYARKKSLKLPCFEFISFKGYIGITEATIDQEI